MPNATRTRAKPGQAQEHLSDVFAYEGDDCLIWPYARNSAGYGHVVIGGQHTLVHRLACAHRNGPPPDGAFATHKCGNGHLGCCNPSHLKWATPKENSADIDVHGRRYNGEAHHMARLNADSVRAIRSSTLSNVDLATLYGVAHPTISLARRGLTWGHVK